MTKTYAQIQQQIVSLQREADKLKRKEVAEVVAKIKEAIEAYELTADDLGFAAPGQRTGTKRAKQKPTKKAGAKTPAAKYKDADGNTWVGRGPRPLWLRNALAAGRQLEEFAVKS